MNSLKTVVFEVIENNKGTDLSIEELSEQIKKSLSVKNIECAFINIRTGFNKLDEITITVNDTAWFISSEILSKYTIERDGNIIKNLKKFIERPDVDVNTEVIKDYTFMKMIEYKVSTPIKEVQEDANGYNILMFNNNSYIRITVLNNGYSVRIEKPEPIENTNIIKRFLNNCKIYKSRRDTKC